MILVICGTPIKFPLGKLDHMAVLADSNHRMYTIIISFPSLSFTLFTKGNHCCYFYKIWLSPKKVCVFAQY